MNTNYFGGRHAFRYNLFVAEPTKRIFATIVAAMHRQKEFVQNIFNVPPFCCCPTNRNTEELL